MSAVSKADVLETYADLYDVFEDNKAICKELDKIYDRLNTLPSAQPDIVRCKECIMHGVCRFEQGLGLDGYCSQAERRTDE